LRRLWTVSRSKLVTFNGNTFDLPVLRYRAMIHAVAAPGLTARPYFNRYTEDALDLCDVLSSFAPHTKASLNELSRIMSAVTASESSAIFGVSERIPDVCSRLVAAFHWSFIGWVSRDGGLDITSFDCVSFRFAA
jgi:hypothetical protein